MSVSRLFTPFRPLALLILLLNATALGAGAGYLLGARWLSPHQGGSVAGAAFLAAVVLTSMAALRTGRRPRADGSLARRAAVYAAVGPAAMLGMMVGNFLLSSRYEPFSAAVAGLSMLVYGSFGVVCLLGAWVGFGLWKSRPPGTAPEPIPGGVPPPAGADGPFLAAGAVGRWRLVASIAGGVAGTLYASLLGFALFLGALMVAGGRAGHALSWYAIFGAPFSLFWGGMGLQAGTFCVLMLRGRSSGLRRVLSGLLVAVGVLVLALHLLPSVAVAMSVPRQRSTFEALMHAIAPEHRAGRGEAAAAGFNSQPFSLTGYFLGVPRPGCEVRPNVLFFEGSAGSPPEDRALRLYFDAFLPPEGGTDGGARPVLIRIHGGGWRLGDKGVGNMMQVNRRFAVQGYAVFDVQYGLKGDPSDPPVITPGHVLGSFSLDDMMRHLGYFTRYLEENAAGFGADLGRVYVSGGSAGGQLTCALGLALDGGDAVELFGTGITVRGLVPFYPANGVSPDWIGGQERWRNPESLVRADSPPCLVFQGAQDGMVRPESSLRLCRAYRAAKNPVCAVLLYPFAPHAADLYYPGYYSQVFLYFMERFLYALR